MSASFERNVTLQIYIQAHCYTCEHSKAMANQLRKEFPTVQLEFVDFADATATKHPNVFATPTFVLDGTVVSLGNPEMDRIRYLLRQALNAVQPSHQR